jgi:hypothetical protein
MIYNPVKPESDRKNNENSNKQRRNFISLKAETDRRSFDTLPYLAKASGDLKMAAAFYCLIKGKKGCSTVRFILAQPSNSLHICVLF